MTEAGGQGVGDMPLTPEQKTVVTLPPTAKVLVSAGPGTGKTHALIARLAHLVDDRRLRPGDQILVLSFSRAAVREIRTRLRTTTLRARYVSARTFDSFATRLLSLVQPDGAWQHEDYDGRIRAATDLLCMNDDAIDRVGRYRHVLVDEIQDLVGDRAELVKALLEAATGGFTLLGDPAQGIYNWTLKGRARRAGSSALYRWLRNHYGEELQEHRFRENHRAETDIAKIALWAGQELNSPDPDYEGIRERLDMQVTRLVSLGTVSQAASALRASKHSTAILCRTNGQALVVSRELHGHGVPNRLQRRATDRAVPAWVGAVLWNWQQRRIGRSAFLERAASLVTEDEIEPEAAWATLTRLDPASRDALDVGTIGERIRSGSVPDDLIEVPDADLVVSTIHRAKGLEFEWVVITDPDEGLDHDENIDVGEETRVLYVALTRPRQQLYHMYAPDTKRVYHHREVDRWVRKRRRWEFTDFEVRGDDTHWEDPAGGYRLECDVEGTQRYIREAVCPGDPVTVRRLELDGLAEQECYYAIEHEGRPVGVTSQRFCDLLYRALKVSRDWVVNWPVAFEGLRVEGVDTVAGTEAAGRRAGLGATGLWLRVRVVGFGALRFERLRND